MNNREPEYFARSLNEAAFIACSGIALLAVRGRAGNAQFVFADLDDGAHRAAFAFVNDAPIPARSYSSMIGWLRRQAKETLGKGAGFHPPQPRPPKKSDSAFEQAFAAAMGCQ